MNGDAHVSCEQCRFHKKAWPDQRTATMVRGECRRHAPTGGTENLPAVWPKVRSAEWCGEFEPAGK